MHVPFCRRKCHYCAFYSVKPSKFSPEVFLDSLGKEIKRWTRSVHSSRPVRTIYFGGGTPTMLSLRQWEKLAALLERNFDLSKLEELTIEANPESLEDYHLEFWKGWKATRISLGIQSINDNELLRLGRLHDSKEALAALDASLGSGLLTSCDLIFGIPDQNLRSWHETIRVLMRRGVQHISAYQLSVEPGSRWGDNPPDARHHGYPLYRWAQYYFPRKGYRQYEVSSFCRDGAWCLHNLGYWYRRDCIGLGPSAWGLINGRRYKNVSSIETYSKRLEAGYTVKDWSERLSEDEAALETAVLALRTSWGLDLKGFESLFGRERAGRISSGLAKMPERYLSILGKNVALTREGLRVGNALWELLLPDS
ncbi:MAG: radical SAM family heme chaperone HemW [Thermovirgaceae bacterium]